MNIETDDEDSVLGAFSDQVHLIQTMMDDADEELQEAMNIAENGSDRHTPSPHTVQDEQDTDYGYDTYADDDSSHDSNHESPTQVQKGPITINAKNPFLETEMLLQLDVSDGESDEEESGSLFKAAKRRAAQYRDAKQRQQVYASDDDSDLDKDISIHDNSNKARELLQKELANADRGNPFLETELLLDRGGDALLDVDTDYDDHTASGVSTSSYFSDSTLNDDTDVDDETNQTRSLLVGTFNTSIAFDIAQRISEETDRLQQRRRDSKSRSLALDLVRLPQLCDGRRNSGKAVAGAAAAAVAAMEDDGSPEFLSSVECDAVAVAAETTAKEGSCIPHDTFDSTHSSSSIMSSTSFDSVGLSVPLTPSPSMPCLSSERPSRFDEEVKAVCKTRSLEERISVSLEELEANRQVTKNTSGKSYRYIVYLLLFAVVLNVLFVYKGQPEQPIRSIEVPAHPDVATPSCDVELEVDQDAGFVDATVWNAFMGPYGHAKAGSSSESEVLDNSLFEANDQVKESDFQDEDHDEVAVEEIESPVEENDDIEEEAESQVKEDKYHPRPAKMSARMASSEDDKGLDETRSMVDDTAKYHPNMAAGYVGASLVQFSLAQWVRRLKSHYKRIQDSEDESFSPRCRNGNAFACSMM